MVRRGDADVKRIDKCLARQDASKHQVSGKRRCLLRQVNDRDARQSAHATGTHARVATRGFIQDELRYPKLIRGTLSPPRPRDGLMRRQHNVPAGWVEPSDS